MAKELTPPIVVKSIKGEEPKLVKRRPGKDIARIPRDMRPADRGGFYKTR